MCVLCITFFLKNGANDKLLTKLRVTSFLTLPSFPNGQKKSAIIKIKEFIGSFISGSF